MEHDLDTVAKAILVEQKIDKMLDIVAKAREIRKSLGEDHKTMLKATHEVDGLDELAVSLGLAQVSDEFFCEFETTLYEIAEMARNKVERADIKHSNLIEGFIFLIEELKPRSIRHLENFISAATDGEWVDGLFVAHGKDSEFRSIDRASENTRNEFGLNK